MKANCLLFFLICLFSCNQKQSSSQKLCNDFYALNKSNSFEGLFDVYIGGRTKSIYDGSVNQYELVFTHIGIFDVDSNTFITVPVFGMKSSLAEKQKAFDLCDQNVKSFLLRKLDTSENELFESYVDYIKRILNAYNTIKVPAYHNNKNVILEASRPTLGKFIIFHLDTRCKCYYVKDQNSLNEYWSAYFKKINNIGPHWYYVGNPQ